MKTRTLSLIAILGLAAAALPAQAAKNCTIEPKAKWMSEADFRQKVEAEGYTIRKFKQPGTCYEIYGKDKTGKNVEIYFNPVDASIVQSK